jgi:hypothetical protein
MKIRLLVPIAVFFLATIACQAVTGRLQTPTVSNVLFQDDFSNTNSGWDRANTGKDIADYANGAYRIYINEPNVNVWANPGLNFTDARVEVDATKVGGPDDNDYGITCRVKDTNHFYFLIISSDGYYGIGKMKGELQAFIGMEAMLPSEAILQGDRTNHLQADCVGNTLTLYVNGTKVGQASDTEYTSGDIGLIAGTFNNPGTDIHFDNLYVYQP